MQVNGNQKRNQKQSTSTLTFYDWEINSTTVLRVTAPSTPGKNLQNLLQAHCLKHLQKYLMQIQRTNPNR